MDRHLLTHITWDDLQALDLMAKGPYFCRDDRPYHVLIAQQFDRKTLDQLCHLATRIRRIAKSKAGTGFLASLLCHKRAMLDFSQPSSRTFLSFYAACGNLGLTVAEVRDTSTSSEVKGESREDSVRTFSSYFDLIIMRTPLQGFAEKMAWILSNTERPIPIINAGSGKDQHPTQALLDIYTLQRSFEKQGGLEGKSIAFVGDLARGRTVRSLAILLTMYPGVKQYFVAPTELQIRQDVLEQLDSAEVEYEVTQQFENILPKANAIYMTRIQDEWDKESPSQKPLDISDYYLLPKHLKLLKHNAIIMHPLPRRKEIAKTIDSDPRAMYWRQMRNGMWIRTALIATIFGVDDEICRYYTLNQQ